MPPDDGGGRSVPPASPKNEGKVLVVRLGEIVLIHDLKRQGLSVSAIARQLGLDRKTVRRHLERGLEPPAYGPRAPRPTLIAPFEDYLAARVAAYPELSGKRLLREVREMGYAGGYTRLTDFLREVRPPQAAGLRAAVRDAARQAGPGRLRRVQGGVHRRAGRRPQGLAVHDGARPQPLALGPLLRLARTCRPCCAVTSRPSPPWRARRASCSTTG